MPQHSDSLSIPRLSTAVYVVGGFIIAQLVILLTLSNGGR